MSKCSAGLASQALRLFQLFHFGSGGLGKKKWKRRRVNNSNPALHGKRQAGYIWRVLPGSGKLAA
jgi:hypothetical protein